MTIFVFGDEEIALLDGLKEYAVANPADETAVRQAIANRTPISTPEATVVFSTGFSVTFTHEWQPPGMMRHVSISSPMHGKVPLPVTINMILPHLGFYSTVETMPVGWLEDVADGRTAVNLLEHIERPN